MLKVSVFKNNGEEYMVSQDIVMEVLDLKSIKYIGVWIFLKVIGEILEDSVWISTKVPPSQD